MQIDEKKPNILIPNIPENKIKELENIIKPILKGLDIDTEIMEAPISMAQVIKQYETLYGEMRRIGNQLSALKGSGIQVETDNIEKILKLNIQHLTGAFKTLKEEIIKKLEERRITLKPEKHELLLRVEHNIRTKLKIEGDKTPKALALLALSKKPLSSTELAKEIYGQSDVLRRGYVGRLLIPYGKFITAKRRKDKTMEYLWKDQKKLKELME